jgi:hypothetical protein
MPMLIAAIPGRQVGLGPAAIREKHAVAPRMREGLAPVGVRDRHHPLGGFRAWGVGFAVPTAFSGQ